MFRWIFIIGLLVFATVAHAQERFDQPSRYERWNADRHYEGECVVRVRTTSQAQLDASLEIATDVWSERVGIGVMELQVDEDRLDQFSKIGVPYDILIEDLQAHCDAHASDMRSVREIEAQRTLNPHERGMSVHDDSWFATYRTLDEITRYCENIRAQRPDLATLQSAGQSLQGWVISSITISGPDSADNPRDERPVVYIFSTVHAREWIAPMTTCYIASRLTAEYDADTRVRALLDKTRVVIIPVGNPDGYLYTWSDERYWRKNRRDNGDGTFGVDLNRNWGYEWGGSGSSSYTDSNTYRGTEPFSEPETRVLRNTALGFGDKLIAHIDYHSYSQVVIWPFGHTRGYVTPEPAGSIFERIGNDVLGEIEHVHDANYDAMQGSDFWRSAGCSMDWFFGELGVTSYTIELRPRGSDFNPPVDQILPCAQENYAGFLRYLERVTTPYNVWSYSPYEIYIVGYPYNSPLHASVSSGLEYAHPETVQFRSRISGSDVFDTQPMVRFTGTDWYDAPLPGYPCGATMEYFYEAIDDLGRAGTRPFAGEDDPYRTTLQQLVPTLADDMEEDTGWIVGHPDDTATAGVWERVDPEPTAYQLGDDHTTDGNLCWVTDGQAGGTGDEGHVEGGGTSLISPRFSAQPDEAVGFWFTNVSTGRWLDSYLQMYVSNDDGATWIDFGILFQTSLDWFYYRFELEPWIETTDQMRVRFVAFNDDPVDVLEVAIDDFQVDRIGCPPSPADLNGDGTLDFYDVSAFIVAYQSNDPVADFNADGQWDFFDVSLFLEIYLAG